MEEKNGLKRQLGPTGVWALAFGCIIGWGSFVNPGKKFLPNSGVAGTACAMVMGALVMIVIAFSYAYMVPKYPSAGGEFTFARQCFGRRAAFLCGWFLLAAYLTNVPMNSTAIGLIVDGLDGEADLLKHTLLYRVPGGAIYLEEMLLAVSVLVLFALLNMLGVKKAGFVQTVLSALLIVSVFALTLAAIFSGKTAFKNASPVWGFDKSAAEALGTVTGTEKSGFSGVLGAILATFAIAPWAFVGFDTIPQAAEEFRFSYKKVSLIMIVAILFGAFVYIANNTVAAVALENWPERVLAGEWVLLVAAEEILGLPGKLLVGVAVSCAVLSGIMGFFLASSRLMVSMSREGYLPKRFSRISRNGTPVNALVFCLIVSLSGPLLGREALGWFVDMSAIGASIGFFFTCASTLVTLSRSGDGSAFLRLSALLGTVFSLLFVVLQLVPIPGLVGVHFGKESYLLLIVWVVLGMVYYLSGKKRFH